MSTPDVRELKAGNLPAAEFPGGREQEFRIYFEPAAHAQVWQHARADTNVEICGVLVGDWGRDAVGPFLNITASIRGDAAANKFAEVTFTHETWSKINAELDSKYSDRSIVGWYHTHPDFGIFLSDRDRFIQENFFSGAGQIAHVVDPIRMLEGAFVWSDGKPTIAPHFWVGNRLLASPSAPKEAASREGGGNSAAAGHAAAAEASAESARVIGEWMSFAGKCLQYLLVFLVGWLLAGQLNEYAIGRARQEGVALGLFQYGLRPQLEMRLSEINSDLHAIGADAQVLSEHHQKIAKQVESPPAELEAIQNGWKDVELRLNRAGQMLQLVEQSYCLNSTERDLLNRLWQAKETAAKQEHEKLTDTSKSPSPAKKPDAAPPIEKPPTKPVPDVRPAPKSAEPKPASKAEPEPESTSDSTTKPTSN